MDSCTWTRLPNYTAPLALRPIRFKIGCIGEIASGGIAVYPDVCPHCHMPVKIAPNVTGSPVDGGVKP